MHGARLWLFGHNHRTTSEVRTWFGSTANGVLTEESGIVAACGTFANTYSETRTTYSEKPARAPSFIGAPLFQIRVVQTRDGRGKSSAVKIKHITEI